MPAGNTVAVQRHGAGVIVLGWLLIAFCVWLVYIAFKYPA